MAEIFLAQTTLEMDGLLTQEDIDNRFFVMAMCAKCPEWIRVDIRTMKFRCSCGSEKYDPRELRSLRTWSPGIKRKTKSNKA